MFTLERTLHTSLVVNLGVRTLQGILRETIRESRMFLQIPLFLSFFQYIKRDSASPCLIYTPYKTVGASQCVRFRGLYWQ